MYTSGNGEIYSLFLSLNPIASSDLLQGSASIALGAFYRSKAITPCTVREPRPLASDTRRTIVNWTGNTVALASRIAMMTLLFHQTTALVTLLNSVLNNSLLTSGPPFFIRLQIVIPQIPETIWPGNLSQAHSKSSNS